MFEMRLAYKRVERAIKPSWVHLLHLYIILNHRLIVWKL